MADSGLTVSLNFCPSCGTNVYWFAELRPDHFGVAAGCFGEPGFVEPSRVVWNESRHPWVEFPDGVPVFDKGSPPPAAKSS